MPEPRLLTRPFVLCFVANLLQGLAFNLFLHFPGYLKALGADELRIGFITALTAVAAIVLRPPTGRAMDRRGRRIVILVGGAVNVVAVALYLTVDRIGPWLYAVRVAHGLAAHGVERGSVISCQLPNWREFIVVLLAAARLGAVVNPIPPIYRASELRFMLNRLESSVVVVPGVFRGFDHAAMLAALRPALPRVEHVFVVRGTPGAGMRPFADLTDTGRVVEALLG